MGSMTMKVVVPLLGLLFSVGILAMQSKTAFAWDINARCEGQRVVGTIDIPHNAGGGLPYNVFVEWKHPDEHREWVPGAGQDITKTGTQPFSIDVSQTPSVAVELRVRYKDKNGDYGPEFKDLKPCSKPTATPTRTPTRTPTNTPTRTSTPVTPTVTNTPTKTATPVTPTNTPTKTSTPVPPTATTTRVSTVAPPATYVPPTSTPVYVCPTVICPPDTGSGGDADRDARSGNLSTGETVFYLVAGGVVLIIVLGVLGGLVYLQVKYPPA